ncbi:tol-pal system YbgF family protein [Flavihumibacter stibioxidans]|uniref:Tetratricopeptide repeat protein n=1 Tax=Flavihumibacter stibioxidans TaxID=1834163 RepID=A0ABR7M6G9_9BACT|nr:hypothetical protein [Flavihumibacter stibioxidans]MBC6490511.1 hypothetical protein [Flavihumibacter stibioxidans]
MTNDLPIELLLDEYFKGEFPASEWQNRLPGYTSEEIDRLVSRHQSAIVFLQRASVLDQVQSIHRQFLEEKTSIQKKTGKLLHFPWRKFLSVAAMLVVIAGAFLLYQARAVSPERLYENIYSDYQLSTFRSENTTTEMERLYAEGRYEELIHAYTKLTMAGNKDHFLAGISYMKLQQYVEAAGNFDKILAGSGAGTEILFRDEAEYYGGLATIKTGQYRKAYELLSLVEADQEHTYHEKVSAGQLKQLLKLAEQHRQ